MCNSIGYPQLKQTAKKKKYKMVVYQRDLSRYDAHHMLARGTQ